MVCRHTLNLNVVKEKKGVLVAERVEPFQPGGFDNQISIRGIMLIDIWQGIRDGGMLAQSAFWVHAPHSLKLLGGYE